MTRLMSPRRVPGSASRQCLISVTRSLTMCSRYLTRHSHSQDDVSLVVHNSHTHKQLTISPLLVILMASLASWGSTLFSSPADMLAMFLTTMACMYHFQCIFGGNSTIRFAKSRSLVVLSEEGQHLMSRSYTACMLPCALLSMGRMALSASHCDSTCTYCTDTLNSCTLTANCTHHLPELQ